MFQQLQFVHTAYLTTQAVDAKFQLHDATLELFQSNQFQFLRQQIRNQVSECTQLEQLLRLQIDALQDQFVTVVEKQQRCSWDRFQSAMSQFQNVKSMNKPLSKEAQKIVDVLQFHDQITGSRKPKTSQAVSSVDDLFEFRMQKRELDSV